MGELGSRIAEIVFGGRSKVFVWNEDKKQYEEQKIIDKELKKHLPYGGSIFCGGEKNGSVGTKQIGSGNKGTLQVHPNGLTINGLFFELRD